MKVHKINKQSIIYDGLPLSVTLEFGDFCDTYVEEIAATINGTAITGLFTDCAQSMIKYAVLESIKVEAAKDVTAPGL